MITHTVSASYMHNGCNSVHSVVLTCTTYRAEVYVLITWQVPQHNIFTWCKVWMPKTASKKAAQTELKHAHALLTRHLLYHPPEWSRPTISVAEACFPLLWLDDCQSNIPVTWVQECWWWILTVIINLKYHTLYHWSVQELATQTCQTIL